MKNIDKLISHTVLATDELSAFLVSSQCISENFVCFDLWSCGSGIITHLKSKWVRFLTDAHIQEIAELWIEEHVESQHELKFVRITRRMTPTPQQLGPLPFPTNTVDVGGIDWSFVNKL